MVVTVTVTLSPVILSPDLCIWEVRISKVVAVRLCDHTARQDAVVSVDHEAATVHRVESHQSERVELQALLVKGTIVIAVKRAKNALCAVSVMVGVLCIMMQVFVVFMALVVLGVVFMVMSMLSGAMTMWRRKNVPDMRTLVVSVAEAVNRERMHVAARVVEPRQVEIHRHWRLAHKPLPHVNCPTDRL